MRRSGDQRRTALGLAGAALLVVSLGACGGEESGSSNSPAADGSTSQTEKSDSSVKLPEGFPEEVPLPENAELKTANAVGGTTAWRLRYEVPLDEEGRVAKYSKRLQDAGFTVTNPSDVNVSGDNGKWRVDAVIRPPTITFQVMSRS